MSTVAVFNKLEKLAAPPFVTVPLSDEDTRRNIFTAWSKLKVCDIDEKTSTFSTEGELLKAFILRKGTQLRLEKALMFTRRIHTIFSRWKANALFQDLTKFKVAFESDEAKLKPPKTKKGKGKSKTDHVKGKQEVRLPSRQWSNWVIYLTLRDLLLLSKIKYECERTVSYWLGLISCSHHPGDSLIIVGILSRMWAVSSGMVEDYANQVYPTLGSISSLLNATKADNWLEDIDFPNELFTWLEKILGFPFEPASIGGYEQILREGKRKSSSYTKMDTVLSGGVSRVESLPSMKAPLDKTLYADVPSTSSGIRDLAGKYEEDLGVPVRIELDEQQKPKRRKKSQKEEQQPGKSSPSTSSKVKQLQRLKLDERWTKFFKNFKSKLDSELGRKQLLTRIRKYKSSESNQEISTRLIKLRKFVKGNKLDKLRTYIPKFKRFLRKINPE